MNKFNYPTFDCRQYNLKILEENPILPLVKSYLEEKYGGFEVEIWRFCYDFSYRMCSFSVYFCNIKKRVCFMYSKQVYSNSKINRSINIYLITNVGLNLH